MPSFEVADLGRIGFAEAYRLQQDVVERRKAGLIPDQLLLIEHHPVVTMGRNGHDSNLLATPDLLARSGIAFYRTDRGGDVTYHGPGQLVAWPVMDLREWKRDVGAYVRALEQIVIDTLADFHIAAGRIEGLTGVWVGGSKICAIGVHLSRWVTSHGMALNVATDLSHFQFIVPCGLTRPVTSMSALGCPASLREVQPRLTYHFGRVFGLQPAAAPIEDFSQLERIA
ncbi:MAG: lipoyl(octanoyl) transferase LipB [Bryobacteraceae bacterium]|nr:lipoyl(octanoyl) transferase LipB [Bryobacteraceae bacterium]